MKSIFLITMLAITTVTAFGQNQGFLKPLAKPDRDTVKANVKDLPKFSMSLTIQDSTLPTPTVDSSFQGLRWTGITALAALPTFSVYTGTGLSYQHDTYTRATGRWYVNYAINLGVYAGGQQAPGSLQAVGAVGLSVSLFNGYLVAGVLYSFGGTQHFQAATGTSASLVPLN
jgi:hypothetical protein